MNAVKTWTCEEAARFLQVAPKTLQRMRARGEGPPYVRAGRAVRYVPARVAEWIKDQERQGQRRD